MRRRGRRHAAFHGSFQDTNFSITRLGHCVDCGRDGGGPAWEDD
jgi:hypothetical protein